MIFLKEINILIQQGHIKLIKRDSKDIYDITNKCCLRIILRNTTVFITVIIIRMS